MKIFITGLVYLDTKQRFIDSWKKKCKYEYVNFDEFCYKKLREHINSNDIAGSIVQSFNNMIDSFKDRSVIIDCLNITVEDNNLILNCLLYKGTTSFPIRIPYRLDSENKLVFLYEDLIEILRLVFGSNTDKKLIDSYIIIDLQMFVTMFKPAQISDSNVIEYDINKLSKQIDTDHFSKEGNIIDLSGKKISMSGMVTDILTTLRTKYITDGSKPNLIRAVPIIDRTKLTKFIDLSNLTGGGVYYNKYIKYKNKYLLLKKSKGLFEK